MALSEDARRILAQTLLGEAGGEGFDGMRAVAHVIRNRALSGRFPTDPVSVALQPQQFSTWNSGAGGNNPGRFGPGSQGYETALRAVDAVFGGADTDPTGGATHYWSPRGMPNGRDPYWADSEQTQHGRVRIGNHIFLPRGQVGGATDGLTAIAEAAGAPAGGNAMAFGAGGALDAEPIRAAVNPGPGPRRPSWMIPPPSPPQRPAGLTGPGRAETIGMPMPRADHINRNVPLPMPRPGQGQLRNIPPPMPRPPGLGMQAPRPIPRPPGLGANPEAAAMDTLRTTLQLQFPNSIASGVSAAVLPAYQQPPPIVASSVPGEGDGLPPIPPMMPGTPMARGRRAGNLAAAAQEAAGAPSSAPDWSDMYAPFQTTQTALTAPPAPPVQTATAIPGLPPPRPAMGMGGPAPAITVASATTPQNPLAAAGNAIGNAVTGAASNLGGFLSDPLASVRGTYNPVTGRTDRSLPGILGLLDRGGARPTMFTPEATDTWSTPVTAVGQAFNQRGWLSNPDGPRRLLRMDGRNPDQVNTSRANREMVRNILGNDARLTASNLAAALAQGGTGFVRDDPGERLNSRRGRSSSRLRRNS